MNENQIKQLIADAGQHVRDGLITKKEGARKIAELKARLKNVNSSNR